MKSFRSFARLVVRRRRQTYAVALLLCIALAPGQSVAQRAAQGTAETGTTQTGRIKVLEAQREYRLFVPAGLSRERPVPLVLVFHGGGGTPRQIERESRFSELAAREGFVVVYPAGHGRSWNDGRRSTAIAAQRDDVEDIAFISRLIEDISARHPIDPKRIFATGISNGAMFSHLVGLRLGERIAAIAPVAGGIPEPVADVTATGHVSTLILNGTDDPLVPYAGGDVTVFGKRRGRVVGADVSAATWATHNRCESNPRVEELADRAADDGCTVTRLAWRGCAAGTGVEVYRLNGAGHTWPGGSQYLRERRIGKVCRDIDGTATIWDFFKRHPKP